MYLVGSTHMATILTFVLCNADTEYSLDCRQCSVWLLLCFPYSSSKSGTNDVTDNTCQGAGYSDMHPAGGVR